MNDEERRQFEVLRRTLHPQLLPKTVLQDVGFSEILSCIGRCRLALRQEMRRVSKMLGESSTQPVQHEQPEGPVVATEWYLAGRQGLLQGMRLLEAVKTEFLSLGRIDQKWNVLLDKAFGPQLRQLLMQWMPSDETAVQLAHQLTTHARVFNKPLPPIAEGGNEPQVILDPEQSKQMVIKLLELEGSVLSDLRNSSEQRASHSARAQDDAVDFAPRYFTTACRDLHCAVEWYIHLKKEKL